MSRPLMLTLAPLPGGVRRAARPLAAMIGGALLASAFPPLAEAQAAWLGLVPLLLAVRGATVRASAGYGFLHGLVFWWLALAWLLQLGTTGCPWGLALIAWALLGACLAGFHALFGGLAAYAVNRVRHRAMDLVTIPVLWVGVEFARATVATGFPWNGLGVSQHANLPVAQLAAFGGVYLVSGLVAAVNAGLALMLVRMGEAIGGRGPRRMQWELALVLLLLAASWAFGMRRIRRLDAEAARYGRDLAVAAVQPNIPQLRKWPEDYAAEILAVLESRVALLQPLLPAIDLIVWPETAVPGFLPVDAAIDATIREWTRSTATPHLFGAMEAVPRAPTGWDLYNSAFLYDARGGDAGVYRKRHLVPFGEYVPLTRRLPFLRAFDPLGFSCTPGRDSALLSLETPAGPVSLGVLICFEDVFPYLARRSVRAGADLLVNLTNDAWFDGSSAPVQHMAHSVFRAIETGRPVVRAANTGVTCFIDRIGRLDDTTRRLLRRGEWARVDTRLDRVRLGAGAEPLTVYARYGDWLWAIPCAIATAGLIWPAWRRRNVYVGNRDEDHDG